MLLHEILIAFVGTVFFLVFGIYILCVWCQEKNYTIVCDIKLMFVYSCNHVVFAFYFCLAKSC